MSLLKIENRENTIDVVQGGMGVGISLGNLAGSVAAAGGIGVIAAAQIGYAQEDYDKNPLEANLRAIGKEIKKARDIAPKGILGMNIMVATAGYEKYVKRAVEEGIDFIVSGAGLPMDLPEMVKGSKTKIVPIVSSLRSIKVIMKYWAKKYQKTPDMVVVEGPLAGGHLGFKKEELSELLVGNVKEKFDKVVKEIIDFVRMAEKEVGKRIPVVVGGGVYERADMEHYKELGADGVQMGTRFVTTYECDASMPYKQTYLDANKEDIVLVNSPVGLPGRAIRNAFLERVEAGERVFGKCRGCVQMCDRETAPYCIAQALIAAVRGETNDGLLFCGANAYRAKKLENVSDILQEFC